MRLRQFLAVLSVVLLGPAVLAQSTTSTALSVTAGGNSVTTVKQGTAVTLTATVSIPTTGGAATPPGQVQFCEVRQQPLKCTDIRLLATEQLSSAGTASYKYFPGPGTHTYQAVFLGTHTEAASSSISTVLVVIPYLPTTTALTATLGPGGYTLTATVTGSGGSVPPTGTVTFEDASNNNYVLGTAQLVAGSATAPAGLSFATSQVLTTAEACLSAVVADINGDGKPDLILGIFGVDAYGPRPPPANDPPYTGYTNTVEVFLGNGDGTFTRQPSIPLLNGVIAFAVGDFNGDGKPDLVAFESVGDFAYTQPPPINLYLDPPNQVQVLLGNGDGTFAVGQAIPNPNPNQGYPESLANPVVAVGDFNGDGVADIVFSTGVNGTVAVFFGIGDGTFRAGPVTQAGISPDGIAVGDFNRDGKLDLAITEPTTRTATSTVTILLGNGDGTFTAAPSIQGLGAMSAAIVTGDFNGDGTLDLAVESPGGPASAPALPGNLYVFLGNGDGTFTQSAQGPIGGTADDGSVLAIGDFNGDGIADLITGSWASADKLPVSAGEDTLSLLLGNGNGSFQAAIDVVAANSFAGAISGVALGDLVGSGSSDIASANYGSEEAEILLPQTTPLSSTATLGGIPIVGEGDHDIIAIYSGDSMYQPSTSPPLLLGAGPQPNTLTLTLSPASSTYGQPVTMTATIAPDTAQDHTATGTVTFTAAGMVLGTATIANGVATFTTTLLPIGTDDVIATYSGDTNFAASTGYATETVNGFTSLPVLTSAPNPSYVGQTVTLTAAVSGVGSTIVPAGKVVFYDNLTVIGQGTLDATGHASMTTSTLALGIHTLSFVYAANLGYNGSTSAAVIQVVGIEGSTTTLAAAPNPAGTGQPVTLTAGVTLLGSGAAAGTVTFYDSTTAIGQATIDATGHATFTTSTLALGTHSLTAVSAGNATYIASTSPVVLEMIQTPGFTIALASPTMSLEAYHNTTTTVTLTSLGDFADNIGVACGNAPAYVTCIFTPKPAALAGNGTATVSFYLDTDSILGGDGQSGPLHGSLRPPSSPRPLGQQDSPIGLAMLLSPFGLFALLTTRRRRGSDQARSRFRIRIQSPSLWLVLAATISMPMMLALCSCGASQRTLVPATAPGTYTIPITATGTASGLTRTTQLTLTVTQ